MLEWLNSKAEQSAPMALGRGRKGLTSWGYLLKPGRSQWVWPAWGEMAPACPVHEENKNVR